MLKNYHGNSGSRCSKPYPVDPGDFVHFRKRIGEEEMKRIFRESLSLFEKDFIRKEVKEVHVETTVQEKNIIFPTDRKLTGKVIEHCKRIAKNPIPMKYKKEFKALCRALTQKKDDSNKVYSVHEPEVLCIFKGKEHKKYEFGPWEISNLA